MELFLANFHIADYHENNDKKSELKTSIADTINP